MKISIDKNKCKGCEYCVTVCKNLVIMPGDIADKQGVKIPTIDNEDKCTGCKLCAIMCPDCAIEIHR